MSKLGLVDLEILYLGIKNNGTFDENDLEESDLKRLGIGRLLDSIASLKDRKLVVMNENKSFSITNVARQILWDEKMPLWARILKILNIKSFRINEISNFLRKSEAEVFEEIEMLRKNQLVLMSPQRVESKIIKTYEILQEGIEKINNAEREGFERHGLDGNSQPSIEIMAIVNQAIKDINDSEISSEKKEKIVSSLLQIKEKL